MEGEKVSYAIRQRRVSRGSIHIKKVRSCLVKWDLTNCDSWGCQQPFQPNANAVGNCTTMLKRLLMGAALFNLQYQNGDRRAAIVKMCMT